MKVRGQNKSKAYNQRWDQRNNQESLQKARGQIR